VIPKGMAFTMESHPSGGTLLSQLLRVVVLVVKSQISPGKKKSDLTTKTTTFNSSDKRGPPERCDSIEKAIPFGITVRKRLMHNSVQPCKQTQKKYPGIHKTIKMHNVAFSPYY
jgi:hypothetical protein